MNKDVIVVKTYRTDNGKWVVEVVTSTNMIIKHGYRLESHWPGEAVFNKPSAAGEGFPSRRAAREELRGYMDYFHGVRVVIGGLH